MGTYTPSRVYHPPELPGGLEVVTIPNNQEAIEKFSPLIQGVLLVAYRRDFEQPAGPLSEGAIQRNLFDPNKPDFIEKQTARMKSYMDERGGKYYAALTKVETDDGVIDGIVGIGKASPSRPRLRRLLKEAPNCYVNDIASAISGKGIGSGLMYTMVEDEDYDDDREVVLDAFKGAPSTQWFERTGFEAKRALKEPFKIGSEASLRQVRYGNITVGGVQRALILRRPWLVPYLGMLEN